MYQFIKQGQAFLTSAFPIGENHTDFSIFNDLHCKMNFRCFSIKYVIEGCEQYTVNGSKYNINDGEYLLANSKCDGKVNIDSDFPVKGICIDISPKIISEAFSSYIRPDQSIPEINLNDFFNGESFLENKYQGSQTHLGSLLEKTSKVLLKNPYYQHQISNEFYYQLAESIIADHRVIISQLYNIKTIKHQTRKDLYKKLCKGKSYIEDNIHEPISIANAADHAAISEYHFYRLFKSTFRISPLQYLIDCRLQKSLELLKTGHYSVTEVAISTGFSDLYNFSKSFKKKFGFPPSDILKNQIAGLDK